MYYLYKKSFPFKNEYTEPHIEKSDFSGIPNLAEDLIKHLMDNNEENRYLADEALNHQYFH